MVSFSVVATVTHVVKVTGGGGGQTAVDTCSAPDTWTGTAGRAEEGLSVLGECDKWLSKEK